MKNKFLKRFLSFLLCIFVSFFSVPFTSFAVAPAFVAVAKWVVDSFAGALIANGINNFMSNADPQTVFENKTKFVALLRDYSFKNGLDYDTAYAWLVDCCADWDISLIDKYGDNASDMYNVMHNPVWQLCNNYIYQMDIGTLAKLITEKEAQAPEITEDNKVKVPAKDFNDYINETNDKYSPKNASGKMSYRTDERYHRSSRPNYSPMSVYLADNPKNFYALNGWHDEMYFVFFYRDNKSTYYSAFQYHLVVSRNDTWADDRDEIVSSTYNLTCEFWDMVDGSQSSATQVKVFNNLDMVGFDISPFISGKSYQINFEYYTSTDKWKNYSSTVGYKMIYDNIDLFYSIDYTPLRMSYSTRTHFNNTNVESHDKDCSFGGVCDYGYLASSEPIELKYRLDTTKINNNYYITIGGDTVYDYTITNPETGQSDTIYNYVTNNYTYITNEGNGGSGGSVGGDITVGGHIDVSGDVDVNVGVDVTVSVPDINININQGSVGGSGTFDPDHSYVLPASDPFNSYYDAALDETSGFRQFLGSFFGFLPFELVSLLGIGLTFVILARIFGR